MTPQHLAALQEILQTLESAATHNSKLGRSVFAHSQQRKADALKEIINFYFDDKGE